MRKFLWHLLQSLDTLSSFPPASASASTPLPPPHPQYQISGIPLSTSAADITNALSLTLPGTTFIVDLYNRGGYAARPFAFVSPATLPFDDKMLLKTPPVVLGTVTSVKMRRLSRQKRLDTLSTASKEKEVRGKARAREGLAMRARLAGLARHQHARNCRQRRAACSN